MVVVTQSYTCDEMAQNHTHIVLMPMSKYCYCPTSYNVPLGGVREGCRAAQQLPVHLKNSKFLKSRKKRLAEYSIIGKLGIKKKPDMRNAD